MKSTWHCPWKEGDGQWSGGSTGPTSNSGSIRCFPVAVLAPQLLDTPGPSPRAEGQPGEREVLELNSWGKDLKRLGHLEEVVRFRRSRWGTTTSRSFSTVSRTHRNILKPLLIATRKLILLKTKFSNYHRTSYAGYRIKFRIWHITP